VLPLVNCCNNSFVQATRKYSKQELWATVTSKPFSYFARQPVGKVQSYIKDVSFACRELEQTSLGVLVQLGVMLVMYTIILASQNLLLGLLYLLFFVGYMLISIGMARRNRKNIAASLKSASRVNEYIIDYYRNVETILSSMSNEFEGRKMDQVLTSEETTFKGVQNITNQAALFQQFLIVILACVIAMLGQYLFGASGSESLSVVLILLYSVLNLSGFGTQYLAIEEFLNRIRSGLAELEYGKSNADSEMRFKYAPAENSVVVENVDYAYDSHRPLFRGLNLRFPKGKLTAVVGPNGKGKSTLIKILVGFYPLEAGWVIFPFKARPTMMYVAQDAPLFNRSIMANICYPNNTVDAGLVFKLVKEIGLDTLIHSEKDLLTKTPGDFKNRISGGEEQKILFLRAFVTKPQVLLLDELTSNLDENAIANVYSMIKKYLPGATVISVVHRNAELHYYDDVVQLPED
ncbi:ABC transporter ATP-binding protein, partial [Lactobacillus sp. XV13L]|nr:ABC transporter ATP-binding protein [Lactobacillus sp. XV13L]